MTNPLIAKYEELYHPKKEEPKPVLKPDIRHDSTIRTLEALLEDLKSGRAIMTDCRTDHNYNHLGVNPIDYFYSPSLPNKKLPVDRGDRITIEIFRKYV